MVHIKKIDELHHNDTIQIDDFKKTIGWTVSNNPMRENSLGLGDGTSVAYNKGVRINGNDGYTVCYKYDIVKGIVFFPIVFAKDNKCFMATSKDSIEEFVETGILNEPFAVKKEIMKGYDHKEIKKHEMMFKNRLPIHELYDWNTDRLYGYQYIEIHK